MHSKGDGGSEKLITAKLVVSAAASDATPFMMAMAPGLIAPKKTTYYLKPLQVEQRMKAAPSGSCASLSMTAMTLPTITSWVDPAMSGEPVVAGPAAVIGGETQ